MSKIEEAKEILRALRVPAKQQNNMCCCVLLALADLKEEQPCENTDTTYVDTYGQDIHVSDGRIVAIGDDAFEITSDANEENQDME